MFVISYTGQVFLCSLAALQTHVMFCFLVSPCERLIGLRLSYNLKLMFKTSVLKPPNFIVIEPNNFGIKTSNYLRRPFYFCSRNLDLDPVTFPYRHADSVMLATNVAVSVSENNDC